jgi:hypothetical protein
MKAMIDMRGQRSFSVEDNETPVGDTITQIVFRSFDENREYQGVLSTDGPVSTEGKVGIKYCPWCGKKIKQKNTSALLDIFSRLHK